MIRGSCASKRDNETTDDIIGKPVRSAIKYDCHEFPFVLTIKYVY